MNCNLCPRYHMESVSKYPGCCDPCFWQKYPSCSLITCTVKQKGLETCVLCHEFGQGRFCCPSSESSSLPFVSNSCFGTGALRASSAILSSPFDESDWLVRQNQNPPIFQSTSGDYGVKSSVSIFLGGASTMEGRGDNPVTFQKKSSLFGVSPVNPWWVCLPIS